MVAKAKKPRGEEPLITEATAQTKAKPRVPKATSSVNLGPDYVSNPFTVFVNSFKNIFSVNLVTLLIYVAIATVSILVAAMVGIIGALLLATKLKVLGLGVLIVLVAIGIVWWLIILTGFTKYGIATARGQEIDFKSLLKVGYNKAAGYLGLMLLITLAILAGLILLIIPGLIFMYWFFFAPYIYIDQNVGVVEAMRQSRRLVKGKLVEILGLIGATYLFALPAYLPFLGIFYQLIYSPASVVAWSYRYVSAKKLADANKAKPPTDNANWWGIILILIVPVLIALVFIASNSSR
ncbi:hypothetical protein HY441_02210 [Candidatus Microgenomates bacterium]|nr:hypothetical protein [Candidatus Microgenomates bacterium]